MSFGLQLPKVLREFSHDLLPFRSSVGQDVQKEVKVIFFYKFWGGQASPSGTTKLGIQLFLASKSELQQHVEDQCKLILRFEDVVDAIINSRKKNIVFEWFFEPLIRAEQLQKSEELYLSKLVLLRGFPDRMEAWQNGGIPPIADVRRAELEALSRRYAKTFSFALWDCGIVSIYIICFLMTWVQLLSLSAKSETLYCYNVTEALTKFQYSFW